MDIPIIEHTVVPLVEQVRELNLLTTTKEDSIVVGPRSELEWINRIGDFTGLATSQSVHSNHANIAYCTAKCNINLVANGRLHIAITAPFPVNIVVGIRARAHISNHRIRTGNVRALNIARSHGPLIDNDRYRRIVAVVVVVGIHCVDTTSFKRIIKG